MKIEIVREERVTESVFPGDTPLSEVMEDVYHDRHVWQRTPVTEVRRVDAFGRVHERLSAATYAARKGW